jgi:hypothetical protein
VIRFSPSGTGNQAIISRLITASRPFPVSAGFGKKQDKNQQQKSKYRTSEDLF